MHTRLLLILFTAILLALPSGAQIPPAPAAPEHHPIGYIDPQNPYPAPERSAPGGCTLTGTVLDADGKPVKDAQVYFGNEALKPPSGTGIPPNVTWTPNRSALPTVKTDADGKFLFNYMYAGRTELWAETATTVGWTRDVESNTRDVTIRLVPKAESLTYEGILLDTDGKSPVVNARILLLNGVSDDPQKIQTETTTDQAGQYHLEFKPARSPVSYLWLLVVPEKGAIAWTFVPYLSASKLDLQLKPQSTFTGRVVSTSGVPISDATVRYYRPSDPQYGILWRFGEAASLLSNAQTDKDGKYTLNGIPQGTHLGGIVAQCPEYDSNGAQDLDAQQARQPVPDILLAQGATFEGTIYLTPGKPAEGANVTVDDEAGEPKSVTTDKDGHYRVTGVANFDIHAQTLISAQAGGQQGSPPQWEAAAYYEQPRNPGEHITVDLTLKRSFAFLEGEWKQKPGTPLVSKYNIAILDDADPEYARKTSYDDAISMRDPAGKTLWEKKGLNVYPSFRAHTVAADSQRKTIWVCENMGDRLLQYSSGGALNFEMPVARPDSLAVDPKTGNAWVLSNKASRVGDKLLVFSPEGKQLHQFGIKGVDIGYSAHDDCFWVVGKNYEKIDREGVVIAAGLNNFGDAASSVSVNEKDGSVWIVEGRHPQIINSRSQIHIVEPDGTIRKTFSLDRDHFCVAIDNQRSVAWISGRTRLFKTNLDGKPLAEIPLAGESFCVIEPDTGYVWRSGYKGAPNKFELDRLDTDGRPVWHDPSTTRKALCFLPPSP